MSLSVYTKSETFIQLLQHIQFRQQHPWEDERLEQHYEQVDAYQRTIKGNI